MQNCHIWCEGKLKSFIVPASSLLTDQSLVDLIQVVLADTEALNFRVRCAFDKSVSFKKCGKPTGNMQKISPEEPDTQDEQEAVSWECI